MLYIKLNSAEIFNLLNKKEWPDDLDHKIFRKLDDEARKWFHKENNTNKIVHMYIRDKHNHKIGVVFAQKLDNKIMVGWSACRYFDKFYKYLGVYLAANCHLTQYCIGHSSVKNPELFDNPPAYIRSHLEYVFLPRIKKYFKVAQ